ncbi:hypothetical protein KDU71_22615 [Carboxylicivirga sediminis]|uniref:Uncharacterized protein n=1 Tax=Carboxylicivirga sediminis TaxID=2006564 RepID=A0A941F8Z8_9BACT|nr:hypothetical protein [Carboxylicivirga sediminis]MBR8538382.1 hypothetical protein [Carboxylicivirga sediminis]
MNKLIIILGILSMLNCNAQQYKVPESFKHLKKVHLESYGQVFAFLPHDYETKISIEEKFNEENPVETIIGIANVNKTENLNYMITFTNAPSDDYSFSFYSIDKEKYEYKFTIGGKQLFIPGNGFAYVSGHTNNMFDKKRKIKFEKDTISEVKQPLYFVGLKTKTLKPIKLYESKEKKKIVASLPANSNIEVVVSEFSDDAHYFLIKTSFGLLGWWELDFYYSREIENLFFAGD